VHDVHALQRALRTFPPGERAELEYVRGVERRTGEITPEEVR
jgi:hypothetical protein